VFGPGEKGHLGSGKKGLSKKVGGDFGGESVLSLGEILGERP